jgi:hypothetical protein
MSDQEFKPDTVVGWYSAYGSDKSFKFSQLKPEIQSRLLAPSAPGLEMAKVAKLEAELVAFCNWILTRHPKGTVEGDEALKTLSARKEPK